MVSFNCFTGFANVPNMLWSTSEWNGLASVCRGVAEISKQEHDATILSLLMEVNANHVILKFYQC